MIYLTKNKHWDIVEEYNIDKILYLLIDRPKADSFIVGWYWGNNKKEFHRNYDLPAVSWRDNKEITWYLNSNRIRSK